MSKFKIEVSGCCTGYLSCTMELDPNDFLYCESESDLISELIDAGYNNVDYGDFEVDDWYCELSSYSEFIKEWKKLKLIDDYSMDTVSVSPTTLPEGTYSGIVGGYICKVTHNKEVIEIKMDEGVRGFGYKATVVVDSDGNAKINF